MSDAEANYKPTWLKYTINVDGEVVAYGDFPSPYGDNDLCRDPDGDFRASLFRATSSEECDHIAIEYVPGRDIEDGEESCKILHYGPISYDSGECSSSPKLSVSDECSAPTEGGPAQFTVDEITEFTNSAYQFDDTFVDNKQTTVKIHLPHQPHEDDPIDFRWNDKPDPKNYGLEWVPGRWRHGMPEFLSFLGEWGLDTWIPGFWWFPHYKNNLRRRGASRPVYTCSGISGDPHDFFADINAWKATYFAPVEHPNLQWWVIRPLAVSVKEGDDVSCMTVEEGYLEDRKIYCQGNTWSGAPTGKVYNLVDLEGELIFDKGRKWNYAYKVMGKETVTAYQSYTFGENQGYGYENPELEEDYFGDPKLWIRDDKTGKKIFPDKW